jgi:hypothetical protein
MWSDDFAVYIKAMETKKNFQEELDVHFRSIELEIDKLATAADDAELRPVIEHQITAEKKLYHLRRARDSALDSIRVEVEQALYMLRTSLDQFIEKRRTKKGK